MLKATPKPIFVIHVIFERHLNNRHAIASHRSRFALFDIAVSEDVVFKRFRNTVFNFFYSGTWINCNHNALTHRKFRELIFSVGGKAINAKQHQKAAKHKHNAAIAHGYFNKGTFLFHRIPLLNNSLISRLDAVTLAHLRHTLYHNGITIVNSLHQKLRTIS